jgi:uncharacterized protein
VIKNSLYSGTIQHRRFEPIAHAFEYQVAYYYLNLDEVEKVFKIPFLFSFNFPGLLSFWSKDYLNRARIETKIREATGQDFKGDIYLLTNISYFGFCFNPVSFYYGFEDGELKHVVFHVTNTPWGEKHLYYMSFDKTKQVAFQFPKEFHVSPFMQMEIDYTWVVNAPEEKIRVLMQNRPRGEKRIVFDSTLELTKYPLSFKHILFHFLKFPFVTFKTSLAIYYQAILLWIKKSPFYSHPLKSGAPRD